MLQGSVGNKVKRVKRLNKILLISCCLALASSCSNSREDIFDPKKHDLIDPQANLSRDDFRGMRDMQSLQQPPSGITKTEPTVSVGVSEPPIPDLAEILAAPKPPKVGETKLVSLSVTDQVPLKDTLIKLAQMADVEMEVDSNIQGGITFIAIDRPFNEVIERISDLAGLRYTIKNNVLRIERDMPYIQTYSLNMLNTVRNTTSDFGVDSSGGGSGAGGGGGSSGGSSGSGSGGSTSSSSASNKSKSQITQKSDSDFWAQFESSVKQIIAYKPSALTTVGSTPATPLAPATPGAAAAPATPVVQSSTVPAAPDAGFYIINREAGTLTVSATQRQHDIIKRFIGKIEANASQQVLIEAKIVEVNLNDNYASGIDWTKFGNGQLSFSSNFRDVTPTNTNLSPANISILSNGLFGTGVDLSAAVSLLSEFGTTRALSSPRLNAMNNQQAVLTFVENILYFEVELEVTPGTRETATSAPTEATVDVKSTTKQVPVGIILSLQPSINPDTNEITMSVRPTLSRVIKFVDNPAYPIQKALALSNLGTGSTTIPSDLLTAITNSKSLVPQVETRELDSILKVKSGQTMVIGGLLEDRDINNDVGIPGVSEVPYIGNLFKSVEKTSSKKELVIFIRATVVTPSGSARDSDKALYEKFIQDPDPLKF